MDERLRGGQKGQSDEELDSTLDKALMLFRYIQVGLSTRLCSASSENFLQLVMASSRHPMLPALFCRRLVLWHNKTDICVLTAY